MTRSGFKPACESAGAKRSRRATHHSTLPRERAATPAAKYRKGLDPDREMIKLSTYLGHAKPELTYWYIEAVPELLQLASRRAERTLAARITEGNGR